MNTALDGTGPPMGGGSQSSNALLGELSQPRLSSALTASDLSHSELEQSSAVLNCASSTLLLSEDSPKLSSDLPSDVPIQSFVTSDLPHGAELMDIGLIMTYFRGSLNI